MPKSTRDWAKRKLDEARKNIEWCGYHMEQVIEVYKPSHTEVSSPLEILQKLLVEVDNGLERVRSSF